MRLRDALVVVNGNWQFLCRSVSPGTVMLSFSQRGAGYPAHLTGSLAPRAGQCSFGSSDAGQYFCYISRLYSMLAEDGRVSRLKRRPGGPRRGRKATNNDIPWPLPPTLASGADEGGLQAPFPGRGSG